MKEFEDLTFCFDIDGTLRDNVNHEVSSSTKLALDTLKEMGYKLIISTGRAYDSLKRTKINELIDWDGFVLNNGQLLLDHNENVLESFRQRYIKNRDVR